LREDTLRTSFKQPSEKLLLKQKSSPLTKIKTKQEGLHSALCNAILPSSAERKAKTHEQLAFYKTATIA